MSSMSNMCNVYSTVPVLKGARTERDLKDIALYCSYAQNVRTGPMANAPTTPESICSCPYGYRNLSNAYQMSAGPFNMSLGLGNSPLNLQYYKAKDKKEEKKPAPGTKKAKK